MLCIVCELRHCKNVNTIHITGLPAIGTSAIHVGYEMAVCGFVVRCINAYETHFKNQGDSKHPNPSIIDHSHQKTLNAVSKRANGGGILMQTKDISQPQQRI